MLPRKRIKNNGCDFELRAFRPDLKMDKFHIYAYSQHNHQLESERKHIVIVILLLLIKTEKL
jgi:hypothetical protein